MNLFDLDSLKPGTLGSYKQPVLTMPDGGDLTLTVLAAVGTQDGPTLTLLSGIHGDEYEGMRTIQMLYRTLDPSKLRGRVIMAPVCNPPAYYAISRTTPYDDKNMARVFPGSPTGTITEQLAHVITEKFIAPANMLIDFHSSGMKNIMPTMIGYSYGDSALNKASQAAALAFGADVAWGHPHDPTAGGRTISAAQALGIPWLYTEAAGARRARPRDVECYFNGTLNVMRHLGMLDEPVNAQPPRLHLVGAGNTDRSASVTNAGYFDPAVSLLDRVSKGDLIGRVLDMTGETLEEMRAYADGRVAVLRTLPAVMPGEGVVIISPELSDIEG